MFRYAYWLVLLSLQFINLEDLVACLFCLTVVDLVDDARSQVVLEEHVFNVRETLLYCRGLGDDVDTIRTLFNHALETAYLTLDDLETTDELTRIARCVFMFVFHIRTSIYPLGGMVKRLWIEEK